MNKNISVVELGDHLFRIGDEIRRQITAIELHAFDDVGLRLKALCLLNGDYAFIADLLHRLGDFLANEFVAIGGDFADLGDLVVGRHLF